MKKKTITIPRPRHQPSKAELEQDLRVKVNSKQTVRVILKDAGIRKSRSGCGNESEFRHFYI